MNNKEDWIEDELKKIKNYEERRQKEFEEKTKLKEKTEEYWNKINILSDYGKIQHPNGFFRNTCPNCGRKLIRKKQYMGTRDTKGCGDFHIYKVCTKCNCGYEYSYEYETDCYISSFIYGKDDYRTNVLRTWRDIDLRNNRGGRMFLKSYYAISPKFVKTPFAKWLRKPIKFVLDKLTNNLLEKYPTCEELKKNE